MLDILIFIAVIVIPLPIGYFLGKTRPQGRNLKHAIFAALPVSLPFFAWAAYVTLTKDVACEGADCEDAATLWAMALCMIGFLTGVTGFGVGLIGDTFARNRAKKGGE